MSGRDKKVKLIELARTALRKKHTGLKDPNDVTKWLVVPGSRKFTGHTERFQDDLEYRKLMQDSGCVDRNGKLTMWTKDDYGNDVFKDFEEVIAQERAQKGCIRVKKGKGRGSPVPKSAPSSSSSQSWSSSSWNWQRSLGGNSRCREAEHPTSWIAQNSGGSSSAQQHTPVISMSVAQICLFSARCR